MTKEQQSRQKIRLIEDDDKLKANRITCFNFLEAYNPLDVCNNCFDDKLKTRIDSENKLLILIETVVQNHLAAHKNTRRRQTPS